MTEKTETTEAKQDDSAKLEKQTKQNRVAKPEIPANVVRTEMPDGTVLLNAVAEA
jgi:hypothetical protein